MTEDEWLTATEPNRMLAWCGQRSERRLLLFGSACCRLWWGLIPEGTCQNAVVFAELYADGECDEAQLRAARDAVRAEYPLIYWTQDFPELRPNMASWLAAIDLVGAREFEARHSLDSEIFKDMIAALKSELASLMVYAAEDCGFQVELELERAVQADLLRCIFGNPFRPVTFDPRWRSETAVALAAGIYAERAFDRSPILADALEDAGCDAADLLAHLRGPGPHVRGCWAVDLVLGKE